MLRLQAGTFDPLVGPPLSPPGLTGAVPPAQEDYYLVQFQNTVLPEWREQIEAMGGILCGYVPEHAYVVKLATPLVHEVQQLPSVRWVGHYGPPYRVSPRLFDRLGSTEEIDIVAATFDPRDLPNVLSLISVEHGEVLGDGGHSGNAVRARIRGKSIAQVAQARGVAWIEEFVPHTVANDVAGGLLGADDVWSVPGVTGTGQIIAVADTGLDLGVTDATIHPDFYGRIVEGQALGRAAWDDPDGHGTHVAGSVLGDGTESSGLYAGVAPSASLVFQSVLDDSNGLGGIPSDLRDLFADAYDAGARIHTNSWGAATYGQYTTDSWNVDRYAWDHPDLAILFAAGNEGVDLDKDGVVDVGSVGAPGTAKNCITVGASENNRPSIDYVYGPTYYGSPISTDYLSDDPTGLAAFSSRGPTEDGRLKPDVVAPGTWVCSARSRMRAIDEGFEGASVPSGWSAGTGWAVTSDAACTGSYGLAQGSTSVSYGNDLSSWVFLPSLDIGAYRRDGVWIALWTRYNIEEGNDTGYVLIEDQFAPGNWYYITGYGVYTGEQSDWTLSLVPVPSSLAWDTLHLAIGLVSDNSNNPGGVPYYFFVDDVRVFSLLGLRPGEVGLAADGSAIDEGYQLLCGTSMATPLTAGGVALLREHLLDNEGLSDPSAALLKAALIASAEDLSPGQYGTGATQEIQEPPDQAQGWGRVNLVRAIAPAAPAKLLYTENADGLAQDESSTWIIEVTDDSVPLRVALVWTDPAPATPSVSEQLVNDLDLIVTDPSEIEHLPMGGTGDHINNVEVVDFSTPAVGTYLVTVEGHDINGADQSYAVAVLGAAQVPTLTPQLVGASPASGAQGVMALDVEITGENTYFSDGVSAVSFSGTGITVNSTTVTDETHAAANISIDLSAPTGLRDVTVTTGDEIAAGTELFEVTVSTLSVSVSPGSWEIGASEPSSVMATWTAATPALGGHFTVSNEGSTTASLMIGTTDSEDWIAGLAPGADTFVVGWGQTETQSIEPSYVTISTAGVPLATDLSSGADFAFDLQCQAPTSSTVSSEQHITVMIGAHP